MPAPLHRYQWEGVAFLYGSRAALLADEMGLGKTIQAAIALALLLRSRGEVSRALIVAPASLTTNWVSELAMWAPSLAVRRVVGDAQDRRALYLLPIPVLVCSYEQVRMDGLDRIPSRCFDLVVLDEAQRIKNHDSTTALACRLLPRQYSWALSATPLENSTSDVTSILGFLDPSITRNLSGRGLRQVLESMMLRRRKSEVREQLPGVIVQEVKLELSNAQRRRYDELWENRTSEVATRSEGEVGAVLLGLLTRLKVICNVDWETDASCKMDALRTVVESAGDDARILIFSQFVQTLKWMSDRFWIPHGLLTGSMRQPERLEVLREFREGSRPRALLISLRAGGVGLNLGEATHVVLFDRWWNPAVERQAMYRAHRFERDAPLHVVRFLVEETVEERIASIVDRKSGVFEEVIESPETGGGHLSILDLMNILEFSRVDFGKHQKNEEGTFDYDQDN